LIYEHFPHTTDNLIENSSFIGPRAIASLIVSLRVCGFVTLSVCLSVCHIFKILLLRQSLSD